MGPKHENRHNSSLQAESSHQYPSNLALLVTRVTKRTYKMIPLCGSVLPSFSLSVLQPFRPSAFPSFSLSVLQPFRPSEFPSFRISVLQNFCPSEFLSFRISVLPSVTIYFDFFFTYPGIISGPIIHLLVLVEIPKFGF